MHVLTVYAHPNPKSFCHAVLEQFTLGLQEAGHTFEVLDLYDIHFDPVFSIRDYAGYVHESMPVEVLEGMHLKQRILDNSGGPIQRLIASYWLRDKDVYAMARLIRSQMPKGCPRPPEENREGSGVSLHRSGLLVPFSCHPEGLVRASIQLRFRLRVEAGRLAGRDQGPSAPVDPRKSFDPQPGLLRRGKLSKSRFGASDEDAHR